MVDRTLQLEAGGPTMGEPRLMTGRGLYRSDGPKRGRCLATPPWPKTGSGFARQTWVGSRGAYPRGNAPATL